MVPPRLLSCALLLASASACTNVASVTREDERGAPVSSVDIEWLSISNTYLRVGALGILIDGYITRLPPTAFADESLVRSRGSFRPDSPAVARVLGALGGPGAVQVLLSGHSHFDHSFDAAVWAKLTGARTFGPRSTCYQLVAQDVAASRCTAVQGGEKIELGDGVTMRVVRWNHSGDPAVNPEQHNPSELAGPPRRDPTTGGLRPGLAEDFPNGGGSRAFLFTIATRDGPLSVFFNNSASAVDLHLPIVIDGVSYGAPLDNLRAALRDAGLQSVDLWIGSAGPPVVRLVLPILKPKAFLPVHWDGLFGAFLAGVPKVPDNPAFVSFLDSAGVRLIAPKQYMDRWRLDHGGMHEVPNDAVKRSLGLPLAN
jgi:hypothetical protein